MVLYSRSFVHNTNNWCLWIRKNQRIIKSNTTPTSIVKSYLYAKDPYKSNYPPLIKKREDAGIKHYNDSKVFMEYSNTMDVYSNINDYTSNRNRKILIAFDDMIDNNKKFQGTKVKELFIRWRN